MNSVVFASFALPVFLKTAENLLIMLEAFLLHMVQTEMHTSFSWLALAEGTLRSCA